jgi:hypothetical protein
LLAIRSTKSRSGAIQIPGISAEQLAIWAANEARSNAAFNADSKKKRFD